MSQELPTVLLSSGFPRLTHEAVAGSYRIIDRPLHQDALLWLQQTEQLPDAVVIGYVESDWQGEDAIPTEPYLPAHRMLQAIQAIDKDLPVVVSTNNRDPAAIVNLTKRGSFDYVYEGLQREGPAGLDMYNQHLLLALARAVKWRQQVLANRRLRQGYGDENLPVPLRVRSAAMHRVQELARKVAQTSATVLITGESGVGKELIARLIHGLSPRADKPYVAVNCGALTDPLLNSELFGHMKGAFTGADTARDGLVRQAAGGTMLLDEIATISPAMQVTMLRVLEERRARAVGGHTEFPVACRFLAASNRPLDELVQRGVFREDLYYRLNVFHIHVPPLRARRDDIAVLAQHFLTAAALEFGRAVEGFEPATLAWLEQQDWPGNARQLRNVVERAVILAEGPRIAMADLATEEAQALTAAVGATGASYDAAMRQFEHDLLRRTLQRVDGNVSAAARLLGMKRTTLTYRLQKLDLNLT